MLFRQLFDPRSSTFTYLLADEESRVAVMIDPVFEQAARDAALLRELGLDLRYTLETHVHADHVTGAARLREALGSRIGVSAEGAAEGADVALRDGDEVEFGRHALRVLATPGHTNGCLSFVTQAMDHVFTGDALLIRGAGRTDFQQGDARRLYRSVHEQLFTLPDACFVHPGHDYAGRTVSTIGEERAFNPRLGDTRSEDDFVGYMVNLGLPHPNQIDVAVPANMQCGRPKGGIPPLGCDWSPGLRSFAGVLEVSPMWLVEQLGEVAVIDVRDAVEWCGELGHIAGAHSIPLAELLDSLDQIPRDRPVVAVCRSGGRSAQASILLEKAGFARTANLAGGMLAWGGLNLPVG